MQTALRVHEKDNVAVALRDLSPGEAVTAGGCCIRVLEAVPVGHKVALAGIEEGGPVIKYGHRIGSALKAISPGQWVHVHNLRSGLEGIGDYAYNPREADRSWADGEQAGYFEGYLRDDGRAGIRNEVWIITTVGCVNGVARAIASRARQELCMEGTGGIYHFEHPYGCSQLGEDLKNTQKVLAGLVEHPNAGGVLVLGLGCENNNLPAFQCLTGGSDPKRVKYLSCQDCGDEIEDGVRLVRELVEHAAGAKRRRLPLSMLTVGLKCGGSDSFSGITANPLLGCFSDRLIQHGGTVILTEVPEMFGAEDLLLERAASEEVFRKMVSMINGFKNYYISHSLPIYENPSPGNKEGGITTLEEKSLGCVQKGGSGEIAGVLDYGDRVSDKGLNILAAPGNDMVSSTALAAAGAQVILFTTGRGTPFGSIVPTVKISTNSRLFEKKKNWIDFDAGPIVSGAGIKELSGDLFHFVLNLASGRLLARNEINNCREMAIFKSGVTL
ncbi:MAG: UxaA family hydrolase [Bacillota bacterium]